MANIAKQIKDQTDSILRRRQVSPGSSMTVRGGATTPGTGPGTPPEVTEPNRDLVRHKASADHDGRYYTEGEIDGMLNFTALSDTPAAYTGAGSKVVAVKADVSGLEFVAAPAATNGVPTGGTNNQLLAKDGATDYMVKWMDAPAAANGLPEGGTSGQVLEKIDGTNYNAQWAAVDAVKIKSKNVNISDFTGKDGYILAYDEVAGEFYLKADDGGGGEVVQFFSFFSRSYKAFFTWEEILESTTISNPAV